MIGLSPEAKLQIRKIQEAYKKDLGSKMILIVKAAQVYFDAQGSDRSEAEIQKLLHQLAGSAGMYGMEKLGDIAREGDHLLAEKKSFNETSSELKSLLGKLQQCAEQYSN